MLGTKGASFYTSTRPIGYPKKQNNVATLVIHALIEILLILLFFQFLKRGGVHTTLSPILKTTILATRKGRRVVIKAGRLRMV